MPEGDTLARIADVLRPLLVARVVTAAHGRPGGVQLERIVGRTVDSVSARGKHLLVDFSNGLTLHTHLGLHGSWHRYRPGERWRRAPSRAVAVVENEDWVTVCFDAPTVELLETRAVGVHPGLKSLGTDSARADFDVEGALVAVRSDARRDMSVGDALLDQTAVAGLGNVYRSELCFLERVNPLVAVSDVGDDKLRDMLEHAGRLVTQNSRGGARVTTPIGVSGNLFVYRRTGRPCRLCGERVVSAVTRVREAANPRRVYWCPSCQPMSAQ